MGPVSGQTQTFNTPLEAGLRALFLLSAAGRGSVDLQRLMCFDYAIVHTEDFGGPPSLHPSTPSKGSQLLVRRALIQDGLELMRSRDLVERRFLAAGIRWRATQVGNHVSGQFSSAYAISLRERAAWVIRRFGDESDARLRDLFAGQARLLEDELIQAHAPGPAAHA
jgi:hypothetical protein